MSGCRAQEKDVRTESGMLDELRRTPPRHVTLPPPLHASTLEPSGWGALWEDRWERPGSCPVCTGRGGWGRVRFVRGRGEMCVRFVRRGEMCIRFVRRGSGRRSTGRRE